MSESDEDDKPNAVQIAEDALYNALDAYGVTKRTTYLISALIDAKIAEAIAALGALNTMEMGSERDRG